MDARTYSNLAAADVRALRRSLLSWYDRNKRSLPWRLRGNDPYAQWVAEVMLQQTRVETVIPYYGRFLGRFPTVKALAAGRHQSVLKLWEGLGYYRRALHLHEAAKVIAAKGGAFPTTAEGWRELPGVGEYTAAAIASIAFGERIAAVDGNVFRVVSRVFGVEGDPRNLSWRDAVCAAANRLVPSARPGDFNQAVMDLGTSVCTPRAPACAGCPVARRCYAHRNGRTAAIPGVAAKKALRSVHVIALAAVRAGRLLMRRRPTGGLWSGLWELPCLDALHPFASEWKPEGIRQAFPGRPAARVTHLLTHRRIEFAAFVLDEDSCGRIDHFMELESSDGSTRWVNRRELEALPVSTAHRKILSAISGKLTSLD